MMIDAKDKMPRMINTLKINIFKPIKIETVVPKKYYEDDNPEVIIGAERKITTAPSYIMLDGHVVANINYCDLKPLKERYNPEKKILTPSCIDNVLAAVSMLTEKYSKLEGSRRTLYDFISIDVADGDDHEEHVQHVKDMICFDGFYIPLDKLKEIGYTPHERAEIVALDNNEYVRYTVALQSASENRLCKVTASTYSWSELAESISTKANYLYEPTQTAVKSIARLGLVKTGGKIIKDFDFTFALVPDLELPITFRAKCFYDSENKIVDELVSEKKTCTDGHGFILPHKAKELARRLELNYTPSAFQIRFGQTKGILIVFDYEAYTDGIINEDILFTKSMWKEDFVIDEAVFLVANLSKPPKNYCEWNYQMFCSLNSQLNFSDVLPYIERVKEYMDKALATPETALQFLGMLADIESQSEQANNEDTATEDNSVYDDTLSSVTRLAAVIRANPKLALNVKWVRKGIKKRINLVCQKMLTGKVPMPDSSIAIMGTDPISFFNKLKIDNSIKANMHGYVDEINGDGSKTRKYRYNFARGNDAVPDTLKLEELNANEFYYGGYTGQLLAFRNPLTHWAQIRKLSCVTSGNRKYWYRHLNQLMLFNVYDGTNYAMGGANQ